MKAIEMYSLNKISREIVQQEEEPGKVARIARTIGAGALDGVSMGGRLIIGAASKGSDYLKRKNEGYS